MSIPARLQLNVRKAPSIRNSPCARLITRIITKITASQTDTIARSAELCAMEMAMFSIWSGCSLAVGRAVSGSELRSELLVHVRVLDQVADAVLVRRRHGGRGAEDLEPVRAVRHGDRDVLRHVMRATVHRHGAARAGERDAALEHLRDRLA